MSPRIACAAVALVALAGCSGSEDGGSSSGDVPEAGAALAPPPGDTSAPAAEVDTPTLLENASARTRESLDVGIESVAATLDGGALATGLATVAGRGAGVAALAALGVGEGTAPGLFADDAPASPVRRLFADAPAIDLDDGAAGARDAADRFLAATLGGRGASVSREGDRITIDPDELALCADGVESRTRADCVSLLGRVLVTVDAERARSGVARWSFDNEDVLRVAYGPDAGSYEIALGGLGALARAAAALDGRADPVPATFEGALRLATIVRSSAIGAEAARLSLLVSEPVRIEDAGTGTRFSFGVSTLWSIEADAAAGTFASRVSLGPVSLAGRLDGGAGPGSGPAYAFELPGWTVDASVAEGAGPLRVALLGIGRGAARLSVDGTELLRARLPLTSLVIDGRETRFEAPLEAAFDLTAPQVGEAFWRFDAPAGTRLVDRGRGIVEVAGGGPWRIEEGYAVDGETYATMRVAGASECVVTDWSDPDGDGIRERFATVGCP